MPKAALSSLLALSACISINFSPVSAKINTWEIVEFNNPLRYQRSENVRDVSILPSGNFAAMNNAYSDNDGDITTYDAFLSIINPNGKTLKKTKLSDFRYFTTDYSGSRNEILGVGSIYGFPYGIAFYGFDEEGAITWFTNHPTNELIHFIESLATIDGGMAGVGHIRRVESGVLTFYPYFVLGGFDENNRFKMKSFIGKKGDEFQSVMQFSNGSLLVSGFSRISGKPLLVRFEENLKVNYRREYHQAPTDKVYYKTRVAHKLDHSTNGNLVIFANTTLITVTAHSGLATRYLTLNTPLTRVNGFYKNTSSTMILVGEANNDPAIVEADLKGKAIWTKFYPRNPYIASFSSFSDVLKSPGGGSIVFGTKQGDYEDEEAAWIMKLNKNGGL